MKQTVGGLFILVTGVCALMFFIWACKALWDWIHDTKKRRWLRKKEHWAEIERKKTGSRGEDGEAPD